MTGTLRGGTRLRRARAATVTVELVDPESVLLGTATLTQAPAGVTIVLDLKGLMPGEHALHLHTTAGMHGLDVGVGGDTSTRRTRSTA